MKDNLRIETIFPPVYYLAMSGISFKNRVIAAMKDRSMTKADLHRASKVPYHAIDKFLKREGSTSIDNAIAIANSLGIKVDEDSEYDELRQHYYELDPQKRKFVLESVRGLRQPDAD